jgi:parvulin-like peptidyl-prolyl isomerase
VFTPKLEGSSGDAQIDKLALAYVQSCRYTPAQKDGAPVRGTAVMALDLQRAAYDDAALRAVYLRVLPSLEARMAGKNDYKVAHILTKDEATARKAHAAIVGGAAFADQARLVSIDRGGKDGGALEWRASSAYVGPFAAALTSAKGQGLLPDVVKTEFGWHVIRIDGVRPTPVPTFAQLRATIKGYVLADQVAKLEELARAK